MRREIQNRLVQIIFRVNHLSHSSLSVQGYSRWRVTMEIVGNL